MNPLNSILVEGNLVRDPITKTLSSGNQVCGFTLATNHYYKLNGETRENEVSYFDVETWSRLATTCSQYLKKGRGVRVVGRLKQDRWIDPEGKPRTKIKIVAEHVEFKTQKEQEPEKPGSLSDQIMDEIEETEGAVVF